MTIKTNREKITAKSDHKPFRCYKSYYEKTTLEDEKKKKKEKEQRKELLEPVLPGVF